ncbi:MAG: type II toxin-antitoxin system VapC family toxin [Deltaproteobacteria bacterium]|nr:type II toxin-antitoxin system VapC family toxin [Deltaproteobacteria bacterium]
MQTVMIDTDIAIDFLRGDESVKNIVVELWQTDGAYISILTVYELYAGIRDKEKKDTDNFIDACNIEPITLDIAKLGGELFRKYKKKGITLASVDCLIMATAIIKKHKVFTRNTKHYPEQGILKGI